MCPFEKLVTKKINKHDQLLQRADVTNPSFRDLIEGLRILVWTNENQE